MREKDFRTIFDKSKPGKRATVLNKPDFNYKPIYTLIPSKFLRIKKAELPELAEIDVVRHFSNLASKNMGVDTNFYPLGSCTMKYNPRINEKFASMPEFAFSHPYQPFETIQGLLSCLFELQEMLCEISGLAGVTLSPAAGAHGELTGLMLIKAYHRHNKDFNRTKIIIPDSAHGTNPASAAIAGLNPVEIKSGNNGRIDIEALKTLVDGSVAGMMVTNPNTVGLFESNIAEAAKILHDAGALLYMDGANMNALAGITRPGDFGVDVMHFNVHKTFSTPHGGGGPGAGPVACCAKLKPFLPIPRIEKTEKGYVYNDKNYPDSIGRVKLFYGNVGVLLKAYIYLKTLGKDGVKDIAEIAVLNANYLRVLIRENFALAFDEICMHEAVFSDKIQEEFHVTTKDIGKRLLDYGFHAPTIYFPMIVHGAIMIEPTETESKETLDRFAAVMKKIAEEARTNPELVKSAPHNCSVKRIDDVRATKIPIIKFDDIETV